MRSSGSKQNNTEARDNEEHEKVDMDIKKDLEKQTLFPYQI